MNIITTFKNQCKIKLFVSTWCIGIGTDQLTPAYKVHVTEQVMRRYDNLEEYKHNAKKSDVVPFCKQKFNYNKRAKNRH